MVKRANSDNLRIQRADSTGTTNLLYDGSSLICETNTSGGIVAWYTPGVGFRRAGVPYEYRENAIGSTMSAQTRGPGTEHNQIEKWASRRFENPPVNKP